MKWIKENKKTFKWIATFPSDTPFFETSFIEEYKKKLQQMKVCYILLNQTTKDIIFLVFGQLTY